MEKIGRVVYLNGEFVPEAEAKISIYDSALMFGDMVFEMTRSFNKKQFRLREHLERLFLGLKILRIPMKMTIEELEKACLSTIEMNEPFFSATDEHRLMINVSRGQRRGQRRVRVEVSVENKEGQEHRAVRGFIVSLVIVKVSV